MGISLHKVFFKIAISSVLVFSCAKPLPPETPEVTGDQGESSPEEAKPEELKAFKPTFEVPDVDASYYNEALQKLKPLDVAAIETVDFLKFRYSYIKGNPGGFSKVPDELEEAFYAAAKNKEHAKLVELADKVLEFDFTDIKIHYMKAHALEMDGKDPSFHGNMGKELLDSIVATGNGQTMETAWHVAQVKEEYALLMVLGLRSKGQALVHEGEHAFDVMQCEDDEGNSYTFYFDITEHMNGMARMFSGD